MKLKTTLILFLSALFLYQVQAQCNGATFEEVNGIAVIEAESGSLSSSWKKETGTSGFTGSSFIAYRGSNSFGSPSSAIVQYKVKINSPGTYRFSWRNKIGVIASSNASTEHNDSWLKFPDASDFYGQKGSSRIYPGGSGKSPNPNGASSGGWFKIYTNTIGWSWSTQTSDFDPHAVYAQFNSAGVYTIQIAGRSNGHFIDRMVLYKESSYSASSAQNLSRAETLCNGGGPPPPPPPPPTGDVEISSVQYINADTETPLGTLTNGTQINLSNINNAELTFRAFTDPSTIGSVRFQLTGPRNFSRTDSGAPYSLVGEGGSNFYGIDLPIGNYTLKTTPYSGSNLTGSKGADVTISFSVVNNGTPPPPPPPPSGDVEVTSLQYINADEDEVLGTLNNGTQINLSSINNAELAFRAFTNPSTVGSVRMELSGPFSLTTTDNGSPYAIFGGGGSDFYGRSLPVGTYTLKATAFSGSNATGSASSVFTVGFTVVNNGTPPPPPPPPPPGNTGVTSFVLVDADTNLDIDVMSNGEQYNSNSLPSSLSIRAETNPTNIGGVSFSLTGPINASKGEGAAPYYLFGDIGVDPNGRSFPNGNYTITATPSSGSALTINFTISGTAPPPPPPPPSGGITFTLVNGNTNQDIATLSNGSNVSSGSNVNIRVNSTFSGTKSVYFRLQGPTNRVWTENVAPYALFGDFNGNYNAGSMAGGSYSLTVDVYSGSNRTGSKLGSSAIDFSVGSSASKATVGQEVYVYPNPIKNGRFSVKLPEDVVGDIYYSLISTSGAEVETGKLNIVRAGDSAEFNLDSFNNKNNGVYYLILQSNVSRYTIPLIKK